MMSQHKNKTDYYYKYIKYKTKYLDIKGGSNNFQISSPNFKNNGYLDKTYMYNNGNCKDVGNNIFPTIEWTSAPANTKSFALIVDDKDAKNDKQESFIHLICWNIPSSYSHLVNDDIKQKKNLIVGKNSWSHNKYDGPCPPFGTHRYFFTL
jgi:Raf kinase inhibitor-like YbhB/YbcL family protein